MNMCRDGGGLADGMGDVRGVDVGDFIEGCGLIILHGGPLWTLIYVSDVPVPARRPFWYSRPRSSTSRELNLNAQTAHAHTSTHLSISAKKITLLYRSALVLHHDLSPILSRKQVFPHPISMLTQNPITIPLISHLALPCPAPALLSPSASVLAVPPDQKNSFQYIAAAKYAKLSGDLCTFSGSSFA